MPRLAQHSSSAHTVLLVCCSCDPQAPSPPPIKPIPLSQCSPPFWARLESALAKRDAVAGCSLVAAELARGAVVLPWDSELTAAASGLRLTGEGGVSGAEEGAEDGRGVERREEGGGGGDEGEKGEGEGGEVGGEGVLMEDEAEEEGVSGALSKPWELRKSYNPAQQQQPPPGRTSRERETSPIAADISPLLHLCIKQRDLRRAFALAHLLPAREDVYAPLVAAAAAKDAAIKGASSAAVQWAEQCIQTRGLGANAGTPGAHPVAPGANQGLLLALCDAYIAVEDLDRALDTWQDLVGGTPSQSEDGSTGSAMPSVVAYRQLANSLMLLCLTEEKGADRWEEGEGARVSHLEACAGIFQQLLSSPVIPRSGAAGYSDSDSDTSTYSDSDTDSSAGRGRDSDSVEAGTAGDEARAVDLCTLRLMAHACARLDAAASELGLSTPRPGGTPGAPDTDPANPDGPAPASRFGAQAPSSPGGPGARLMLTSVLPAARELGPGVAPELGHTFLLVREMERGADPGVYPGTAARTVPAEALSAEAARAGAEGGAEGEEEGGEGVSVDDSGWEERQQWFRDTLLVFDAAHRHQVSPLVLCGTAPGPLRCASAALPPTTTPPKSSADTLAMNWGREREGNGGGEKNFEP